MVVKPARALGAPQTISLRPSRVSTWQTRSRSALGCCTASTTLATEKAASLAAGSSTCSTSSPAMVMASTTSCTEASVSRCSLSQDRVNFMRGLRRRLCVLLPLREKVAAKPTDEGAKALSAANTRANRSGLRDPSSDPAPQGHLLPQGEKDAKPYRS